MYDFAFFDKPIDRCNTNCVKWDAMAKDLGTGFNAMWVADMDFQCVPEIQKALLERASHPVYGYTYQSEQAIDAMTSFMERRHGIKISKEITFMIPGVVAGLRLAVRTFTNPGDKIIIQTPIYTPFFNVIEENRRVIAECPLLVDGDGAFHMNFNAIEDALQNGARCLLLCNPHNPVGRCWTKEELQSLLLLIRKYSVTLISDEIHEDFVYAPHVFTPMLSLCTADDRVMSFTSVSKTFNIAGLMQAFGYTYNRKMLEQIKSEAENSGVESGNLFALTATEAAYTYGDAWLDDLLCYLKEGDRIFREELKARLPKAGLTPLEATYLEWLDLSEYGYTSDEITKRTHAVKLACNIGDMFGKPGAMHLRVNIGCPHERIRKTVMQLEQAILG